MEKIITWTDEKNQEIKIILNSNTGEKTIYRDGVIYLVGAKTIHHRKSNILNPGGRGWKCLIAVTISGTLQSNKRFTCPDPVEILVPLESVKEVEEAYMETSDGYKLTFESDPKLKGNEELLPKTRNKKSIDRSVLQDVGKRMLL